MLLVFPLLLRYIAQWSWHRVSAVWLSGVGCGLIHHVPLCLFGMRGYTDTVSLLMTLFTEWPALLLGVAVVEQLGGGVLAAAGSRWVPFLTGNDSSISNSNSNSSGGGGDGQKDGTAGDGAPDITPWPGTRVFAYGMCLALVLLLGPHLARVDDKDAVAYLIPLIPGQHMQSVGTAYMRARTCLQPK